ncbi:UNVERIFIED_CONTAM: hypothetical protein HDU68_008054 [Siphonaria sp. JEL0065]|nr:hypothetical protein HDU68_008054 [Siphonaria sp. JEL0065]
MKSLTLDLTNVEFIDYTGVQTLLLAKDFLHQHTGYPTPINFVNAKPEHLNRLARIAEYIPGTDAPAPPILVPYISIPSFFEGNPSVYSLDSPNLECLPSPMDFESRESSIEFQKSSPLVAGVSGKTKYLEEEAWRLEASSQPFSANQNCLGVTDVMEE